jgi:glycosyltransferase involved in cell wall biosynthesis
MKILITTGVSSIGGPATYSKLLAKYLPNRGVGVFVLSFESVNKLPKILSHFVFFIKILFYLVRYDLIFAQDPVSVGLPSWLAARVLRKKIILRLAGDYALEQAVQRFGVLDSMNDFQNKKYGFRVEFLRKVQVFVLNRVDLVIVPSFYFAGLMTKWLKDKNKIQVIYNGIEMAEEKLTKIQARSVLNIQSDDIMIVSAGRLIKSKGFEVTIDAMDDLLKINNKFKLLIIGEGPEHEFLLNKTQGLNLKDRIVFLGQLKRADLLLYLRAADIFVLNTAFESFSFQVLEAMSYGLPVITSNVCSLPELIIDQQSGFLIDYNDKAALIKTISSLTTDLELREKIAEQARLKARSFSIEKTVDSLLVLLHQINESH